MFSELDAQLASKNADHEMSAIDRADLDFGADIDKEFSLWVSDG